MVENNTFWDKNKVQFSHWKDGSTQDIQDIFYATIPGVYEKYFDNQKCSLTSLYANMIAER
ncbi:hypothetical protein [Entomoplasma freundtii]|uniref:hypothetical protein n=1 Tax=Entomoplasma freundtii TaxID=74700 RepID=UPI001065A5DC|nr:hypothetical protein [Entomoplasma freundtii]